MEKQYLIFSMLCLLFMLPLVSAAVNLDIPLPTSLGNSYGTYQTGVDLPLIQTCTNETAYCDLCNITSIKYPDGT